MKKSMFYNVQAGVIFIIALLFSGCHSSQVQKGKEAVDYVDPFLGTDFFGHTFPGASLPYALVHAGPDTHNKGWSYCGGYVYSDDNIMGFSHTHFSGVGMTAGADVLLMPTVHQQLQVVPGDKDKPDEGYRSRFSHNTEQASPGYYSVHLDDYDVQVEMTTTRRVAFHRYVFPESDYSRIIMDLGHQIGDFPPQRESEFRIVSDTVIEGFRSTLKGDVYFVIHFSKPCLYYGTFDVQYSTPESGAGLFPYKNGERGNKIGAFLQYSTKQREEILIKVALSYVSIEGARKNLETEIPHWNFDRVHQEARNTWAEELNRIRIEDPSEDSKEKFYTAVYRSLLSQYISQDVDGKYIGMDGNIHEATGYDHYGSFSCWDTYRSQHPFLTLATPGHVNDYIRSIEAKIRDFGWLPAQHFLNVPGEAMVGDHLIPIIVDAYKKGYRDYDVEFIYQAMKKKALEAPAPPVPESAGRSGLDYYLRLGYTPVDKVSESVPNTLELAYDDWCIAQLAKELGKEEDYALFMKRAGNYAHLWDQETAFMRPKQSDGHFLEALGDKEQTIRTSGSHSWYAYFDPLLVGRRPNRYYTESNAWQYLWSVQHDIKGLIGLFGSADAFNRKLDDFFAMDPNITPPKYIGVVGTIGQYVHGNQPSHHVAYLYNYSGQPWKTQYWTRYICDHLYRTGPGGLCGNDDMGSLSSWYALSSMGIYSVAPGSPEYALGSPSFDKVTIDVGNGKTFVIRAIDNSLENVYIQSATLNGQPFNRLSIAHGEIMAGGELCFQMGPQPNPDWGRQEK